LRWQNVRCRYFSGNKGVRRGGILSPFLFRFYIRDLMLSIASLNIGCNFADINVNLLAYADDLVLLAPAVMEGAATSPKSSKDRWHQHDV